jgi:hypothetical protein
LNTTLTTQDVVIPRCPTPKDEIKSNSSTSAATGENSHDSKSSNAQILPELGSHNSETGKALHSTAGMGNEGSTAGMGDELVQQLQAEISKKQNNAQENTIFDKFLDIFKFAPLLQKGIIAYADKKSPVKKIVTTAMSQMALFGSLTGLVRPSGILSKLGKIGYRGSIALGSVSNFLGAMKMNNLPFAILNVFKAAVSGNLLKIMGMNIPYLSVYSYTGLINGINNHLSSGMKAFMPDGGYKNVGDSFKVIGQQFSRVADAIKEHGLAGAFKLENTSSGIYGTVGGLGFQVGGFIMKKIGEITNNPTLETVGGFLRGVVGNVAVELNRVDKQTLAVGRKNEVSSGVWYTFEGLSEVLAGIAKHLRLPGVEDRLKALLGATGTIATLCYTVANNEENNTGYRDKPIKPNLADITKVSLITGLTKMFPQSIVNKILGNKTKDELSAQ